MGALTELLAEPSREIPSVPLPEASSLAEILSALDESVAAATARLSAWGDDGEWQEIMVARYRRES